MTSSTATHSQVLCQHGQLARILQKSRAMKPSIVLVDDNEELLFSLTRTFRKAGFEVSPAPDAETALAKYLEARPDLVVTDLRLPGLSGLDLLRHVRERYPTVPVLIITAYGDEDTSVAARAMGAYALLTKPVFREELLSTVRRALAAVGGPR